MSVMFLQGNREMSSVGVESTYGTPVAPTYLLGVNATFDPNKNAQKWEEILGAGTDDINVRREISYKDVGGTLKFTPQDWAMLYYVFGLVATTGSDPYTHTFTNQNEVPSFTFERAIQHTTDRVRTYDGCQVNSLTLNFAAGGGAGGGYIDFILEILARNINNGTSTTSLSAPTTAGFQFRNVLLTLNSTEVVEVLSGTINVNNNLSDGRYSNYTNNELKGESVPQTRKVSGNFVVQAKDDTFFDFWNNRVVIPGTNTLRFQRGANDYMDFTFTNLAPLTSPDPTNLEGINKTTINWEAEYITPIAQDSVATYFAL